ncbi:cyclase family protein [Flavobacterium gawalongense]|uniref:Cyclase family protein n=1 Tax=Flavobacterium gawalongense TaxID=2594432 RepID=A0A553BH03_9FLAO|nr:cyclase family protein [Flavobacterium gawalongense]TRX00588.1 cyclase family protein [Flavobacterium gawalongense]TRX04700.1 cyclase family protein [Flavobacterium gawalongense]TRX07530.1 cyclase family protein [Flavobacterium gawalongense]TRX12971.1 cyclase family protein [Flavobacterium gawalongense]TRX31061.1 cyclase family protein [Flavobacterium gawalongense]
MLATIQHNNQTFEVDLSKPIDISIPLTNTDENPIAWYIEKPVIEPVVFGEWIGKVSEGKSSTNFNNIFFNPHGHGTHTECLGHITRKFYSINQSLKQFFFLAELISVVPERQGEDLVITLDSISTALDVTLKLGVPREAIVIRTIPNLESKKHLKYSNTNPPYLDEDAARFIRESGIQHLLIDLPSVDKEHDEGKLLAHKAFWNVTNVNNLNADARLDCTITEMIFVPNEVKDGSYLLNLQIASFENDASPSKPILYDLRFLNAD